MNVSPQPQSFVPPKAGPRARTARLMLETAVRMMQEGVVPSVTDVAAEAGVSRATAYRYFPSRAALVHAVVDEALGPILEWTSRKHEAEARVESLLSTSLPRIDAFEATFRAALKHALDEWSEEQKSTSGAEPRFKRGHRIDLLNKALAPLDGRLPEQSIERLAKALSLIFGIETLIVLKDIWGTDATEAREVALWAARMLVRGALAEEERPALAGKTR
jgi:AcrR family transcriptional regulator